MGCEPILPSVVNPSFCSREPKSLCTGFPRDESTTPLVFFIASPIIFLILKCHTSIPFVNFILGHRESLSLLGNSDASLFFCYILRLFTAGTIPYSDMNTCFVGTSCNSARLGKWWVKHMYSPHLLLNSISYNKS